MEKMSPEKWQKIEEKVGEAEKAKRQSLKSSAEIFKETGIVKEDREKFDQEEILSKAKRKRVAEKALLREESFESEAEDILGGEGTPERALVNLQKSNLISALREDYRIEAERELLLNEETEILKEIKGEPSGSEFEALEEIRTGLKQAEIEREKLLESSPEAYYGLHLKELKDYKKDLQGGRIVETPYVKKTC